MNAASSCAGIVPASNKVSAMVFTMAGAAMT
jgi:hypothetical protein